MKENGMSDETRDHEDQSESSTELSRRDFVAMSIAAGIVAATGSASAADMPVTETDVDIKTPDGTCNAAFIHPTTGSHPAVIIWADAFGLRPVMREMGRRLAKEGYSVLVPNPFYRVTREAGLDPRTFDFGNTTDREKLAPLMGSINAAGAAEKDALAFVAWLDSQKEVNKSKKIGTQGYCMGGPLVMRTAAAANTRIGAGGSFHGGGLVSNNPDSPHLLAPKIKGRMYFGVAKNDDERQPDAKDKLREAMAAANVPAKIEVYPAQHGWCMSDFTAGATPIYSKPDAERAWGELLALYKAGLA
jgi:carboxymethylenebutenolidase